MFDFRLKVFHTVASRLNFTRAAKELYITQPAVTKHIHEIENYYHCQLFERNGTRIKLTPAGKVLLKHTEALFQVYNEITFDMAAVNEITKGAMRIGASTTVSQYVLPAYLPGFKNKFPGVAISLHTGNTEFVEGALLDHKIDIGIIEGHSRKAKLKYQRFLGDEIVLCTRTKNPEATKPSISLSELSRLPLIVRETGSGSQEVIQIALEKAGIDGRKLKTEMVLDSTETIKKYLLQSNAYAFLSVHAIADEVRRNEIKKIPVQKLQILRDFNFIYPQGELNTTLKLFIKYLASDNLR